MIIKRILFSLPIIVFLFFFFSFLGAQRNFDRKINQLIMSSIGDAEKLNPILATDSASSDINDLVFNGLVKYDENQVLTGSLARDWKVEQISRCYLRRDLEITAEKIIAAIRSRFGEDAISRARISDISAGPDNSLIIHLSTAGRSFEKILLPILKGTLREIKVFHYLLGRGKNFRDGEKINSHTAWKRIKKEIDSDPSMKERFLEATIENSTLLRVLVLDSEEKFLGTFRRVLVDENKKAAGAPAGTETILFENNPEITFYLRNDVKWHDGEHFDADDVIFTYEKIMDEHTNTVRRPMFELVKRIEKKGHYELKVIYKKPFSPSLENWSMGIIPRHILKGQDINTSPFNRHPIGTGPFKFYEWISDEKITLVANNNYFEGRPELDMISYRIIPEPPLKELEFFIEGVDLDVPQPHQYKRYKSDSRFDIYRRLGNGYTYIGWNNANPLFSDKKVRRALTHAINRREIVKYLLYDLGVIATGPFPPHMWYANPDVVPFEYDPEKAKKLLNEAGWKDTDGDGILDREGKPFRFTLMTNNGNILRQNVAVLVQRQLKSIGIQVDIELYEWSVFIRDKINARNFEACVLGWSLSLDPDVYEIWHSSQSEKGFNFVSYSNPEVDRLIEEGRTEYDRETRKRIYFRVHKLIHDDQPYTFLYVGEGTPALHRGDFKIRKRGPGGEEKIEPIKMTEMGLLYHLEDWFRVTSPVITQ